MLHNKKRKSWVFTHAYTKRRAQQLAEVVYATSRGYETQVENSEYYCAFDKHMTSLQDKEGCNYIVQQGFHRGRRNLMQLTVTMATKLPVLDETEQTCVTF